VPNRRKGHLCRVYFFEGRHRQHALRQPVLYRRRRQWQLAQPAGPIFHSPIAPASALSRLTSSTTPGTAVTNTRADSSHCSYRRRPYLPPTCNATSAASAKTFVSTRPGPRWCSRLMAPPKYRSPPAARVSWFGWMPTRTPFWTMRS
jgi:hypothetical protein